METEWVNPMEAIEIVYGAGPISPADRNKLCDYLTKKRLPGWTPAQLPGLRSWVADDIDMLTGQTLSLPKDQR